MAKDIEQASPEVSFKTMGKVICPHCKNERDYVFHHKQGDKAKIIACRQCGKQYAVTFTVEHNFAVKTDKYIS